MATNNPALEGQKQESSEASGDGAPSVKGPAKDGPAAAAHPPLNAVSKGDSVPAPAKANPSGPSHAPPQSVLLVAKAAGVSANSQQVVKQASSHMAPMNQVKAPARTVVISVPRAPKPVAPQTASKQLPASIQIPPGMMLIRSNSGQLMLVSQQALAQAQQGLKVAGGQAPKILAPPAPAAAGKPNEKVTVIRMAASSSYQAAPGQKTAVVIGVSPKPATAQAPGAASEQRSQPCAQAAPTDTEKEPTVTYSRETLESVKKCKNFLVTLIKLASSDSRSATMAGNVKGLVRSLLQGQLEAEEFTERLYNELKSTPQPCLVPFLKKSLPAVRTLTADAQLFIQQASDPSRSATALSSTAKQPSADTTPKTGQQSVQQVQRFATRPNFATLVQSRPLNKKGGPGFGHVVLQSRQRFSGAFSPTQPFTRDSHHLTNSAFKDSLGSYKEDDDINDVASMAGVNLREENAQILTTAVGSVVQSCQDQPFLSPQLLHSRILHAGETLGITEVGPEVVALVSHAAQERLRGLLQKISVMAEHRNAAPKGDEWHIKVSDVRSQLRFLEEVERLKKKRKDEEEKEKLLRLARSRSHTEDPEHQLLKQRAKELQQMEKAELLQREANLTALAAIGPRKKRPLDQADGQVPVLPRQTVPRVTRVMMRDLQLCMEQEPVLRHSLTLYKSML